VTARTWRAGVRTLDLVQPLVMGVLNTTPDSFSDGGLHRDAQAAVEHGRALWAEGAAIVDVGGESTRPGSDPVPLDEETERVLPVVSALASAGVVVSVDTRHAAVALEALGAGASIINDVAGFRDPEMVEVAVSSAAGVVVMHMLGEPRTMQEHPTYSDVVEEVRDFLAARADGLIAAGVAHGRIAVDPGIGFGKTLEHNIALLRGLGRIAELGYPVVVGVSRKRFIGEISGNDVPASRLGGSIAAAVYAAQQGASVVRVHDVSQTVQALAVAGSLAGAWSTGD
jgi:dihydropteroate synthase